MTHLEISDELAPQPNSAQSDGHQGARQLQELKDRLRSRVDGLRKQAYWFLVFAIALLLAGAGVFLYANYIARLTLSAPETATAQYDKAMAAQKRLGEQQEALNRQEKEIINEADVAGPRNDAIRQIKAKLTAREDDVLQHCDKHKLNEAPSDPEAVLPPFRVTTSVYSNEYQFGLLSGRIVSFETQDLANDCNKYFLEQHAEMTQYTDKMSQIQLEIFKMLNINRYNKSEELKPINQQRAQISEDQVQINSIIRDLETRVAQEKYLGITITPENHSGGNADAKIDWPHVIETNATRIGVLAAMFFLVTILIPHYRYSIKIANFYQARLDSLEMLPEKMSAEDLDKIVNIMTPTIDFGKSPPTPWEHILEVMKAAKS